MCRDVPDSTWRLAGTDCVPQSRCPERGRAPGWVLKLPRGREQPRRPAHEPHHECPRRLRFFLAKRLWIVRAQDGAFGLDSRKGDRCSLLNSPRRCVSVGEGTGQRPGDQLDRGGGAGGRVQRLPPEATRRPGPPPRPPPPRLLRRAPQATGVKLTSRSLGVQRPERTRLLVHARPAFAVSARGGR